MSTEIAHQAPRGALSITSDQQDFTEQQLEAFGLQDASRGEVLVFLHTCQRTGLDPAAKQIYAIFRMDRQAGRKKMTIQTGIDGYRLIADRSGAYAGNEVSGYGPALPSGGPEWAEVTVRKIVAGQVVEFKARAYLAEYAETTQDGGLKGMWRTMPRTMLAKCAEALALRKAFPQDLSGVYSDDEMGQAADTTTVTQHPRTDPPRAATRKRKATPPPDNVDVATGEIVDAEPMADMAQLTAIGKAATMLGHGERAELLALASAVTGRTVADPLTLTAAEADDIAAALRTAQASDNPDAALRLMLDTATGSVLL